MRATLRLELDAAEHRMTRLEETWEGVDAWRQDRRAIPHWARALAIARQKAGFAVSDLFKSWVYDDAEEQAEVAMAAGLSAL